MKERIYIITDNETNEEHLVKAPNRARAIKQLTEGRFDVRPATAEDVVRVTNYDLFDDRDDGSITSAGASAGAGNVTVGVSSAA